MKPRRRAQCAVLGLLLALLLAGPAWGAAQALRWQGPPGVEAQIAGYRLYVGERVGEYDRVFDLGLPHLGETDMFGAVVEVAEGEVLYGALASYDREGNESDLSQELVLRALTQGAEDPGRGESDETSDPGRPDSVASFLAMGATSGSARSVTSPPGDPRLFVVEQTGQVRLIEGGIQRAKPFLDLGDQTDWVDGGGLMSLAFDPDYAQNGYLYVTHTDSEGYFLLTRFTADADAYSADPFSAVGILEVLLPYRGNPGGGLAFGRDRNLFVGIGDGGGTGDPGQMAQDGKVMQGKVLRIDVSERPLVVSNGRGKLEYGIPETNPFADDERVRDEVWAVGLHNPEEISVDPLSGDLWVADRGERLRHEVNWESGERGGGLNYAWNVIEGTRCYSEASSSSCGASQFLKPAVEYAVINDDCGVAGGHVYRGAFPDWQGRYFFVDECRGELWSYDFDAHELADWSSAFATAELDDVRAVAMGQGGNGELFIVGSDWGVYKLGTDRPECGDGFDNDGDGRVDYPQDPGCEDEFSSLENALCDDGIDNDGDNLIDRLDPQCTAGYDNREAQSGLFMELSRRIDREPGL